MGKQAKVAQFLGMRYAAPPVGALRFRAPLDPLVQPGVQPALATGPLCLATGWGYPVAGQDEDCLYANVWAPAEANRTSLLPVWVFVQGGGYGVNRDAHWSGQGVVEQSDYGIVVVTFNYRVGMFGFLAGDEVKRKGDLNAGLLDQRKLLQWVQAHIMEVRRKGCDGLWDATTTRDCLLLSGC
jgi:carboxylesterase type B